MIAVYLRRSVAGKLLITPEPTVPVLITADGSAVWAGSRVIVDKASPSTRFIALRPTAKFLVSSEKPKVVV